MAHEITNKGAFKAIDHDGDPILFYRELDEICVESTKDVTYLTKCDTEALIQYLQSKLPELK